MGGENTMIRGIRKAPGLLRRLPTQVRTLSEGAPRIPGEAAHTEHAIQATADWKKYSKLFAMGVAGIAVLEFFIHLSHAGHHHEIVVYPFRKIRNKPFPFKDGQHSLFGCTV